MQSFTLSESMNVLFFFALIQDTQNEAVVTLAVIWAVHDHTNSGCRWNQTALCRPLFWDPLGKFVRKVCFKIKKIKHTPHSVCFLSSLSTPNRLLLSSPCWLPGATYTDGAYISLVLCLVHLEFTCFSECVRFIFCLVFDFLLKSINNFCWPKA